MSYLFNNSINDRTQVGISRTEEFRLGIPAPILESGDLDGTPGGMLARPAGRIEIPEGAVCTMCRFDVLGQRRSHFSEVPWRTSPVAKT